MVVQEDSLGSKLKVIIGDLPSDKATLAEIRDLFGQDGLLLLTLFLSISFLIPVSLPGVSTVFGAAILLISVSRLLNRRLWLPKRFLERQLSAEKLRAVLNKGVIWLDRLESVSRSRRLECLASGRCACAVNDGAIVLGAGLLAAPLGPIPFSNALPALAILFLTIGSLRRDGLYMVLGHMANAATVVYFAFLIGGGGAAALEMFQRIE